MGHYRSAGKPGARSFESNQPVEALVNFNFDEFLERLKDAPPYVKDNVMCYFYHNTSACQDCPKEDCKAREPRQMSVSEMEERGSFDPGKRAEYLVRICDYYLFAVPNPEVNFGLFEAIIKRLGSGEYAKLFNPPKDGPGACELRRKFGGCSTCDLRSGICPEKN